ncbi:PKD domain-containing protein [Glaciibacter sp. 2TAF33]|uniref:PKD domain-containing protein n=1 Tax=Glaciibacter sp. 2TAF33 TaxID=3233015 RepID=UPI003F9336CB
MRPGKSFAAGMAGALLVLSGFVASGQAVPGRTGLTGPAASVVKLAATPDSVHFTASGDFAATSSTTAVLSQIAGSGSDLHLAVGDFSYGAPGGEQAWCDFVTQKVGVGFPFELVSGNHESNGTNGAINDFSACMPNQLPGVAGTYGRQYYVDVPQQQPLVRFIMISPGLTFPDGVWSYAAGTPRYQWTSAAIDDARAAGVPWVVVGMHKPCLSVGIYSCDSGADLANLLVNKRVDLVVSGHEHLYARSKQLALGGSCAALVPGSYNAGCVRDGDSDLGKGAGTVFAIAGTGGQVLRDVNTSDPEAPYFASYSGSNLNPANGNLDVRATPTALNARFTPVAGGSFTDAFTITTGAASNQPPSAEFTPTCTGLSCTFDASASADADGSITGYAWTFGDGASGTGMTATHPYAGAGTYPVVLTVTDNAGATGTATHSAVATDPTTPTTLATDTFTRTVTNGLGAAEVGGAWTTTGSASQYSVNGAARIRFATAGVTNNAYLTGVSSTATDLTLAFAVDKMPTGSGTYVTVSSRRIVGVGGYQAKVVLRSSGTATLALTQTVGSEVVISPAIVVPGVSVAAGNQLRLRLQTVGVNPTLVQAKVWTAGTAEPSGWQRTVSDSTAGMQAAGSIGASVYVSSTSTNLPVVASIDDLAAVAR